MYFSILHIYFMISQKKKKKKKFTCGLIGDQLIEPVTRHLYLVNV